MELIQDLPEVFEEFGEQRRNSFLTVKQLKEQGIPIIGSYCSFFPKELAWAAGAAAVGLCSVSDETIPEAEKDLPKNLCPLIKSSYGFAKSEKCPYFYFSDVVVGETTCDGKKKMYEYMSEFKDVYMMHLPHNISEESLHQWREEIVRCKEYLEKKLERTISEEDVRKAVHIGNEANKALKGLYGLMAFDPAPITGHDLYKVLYGSSFKFDREEATQEILALTEKIRQDYENGKNIGRKPRILITGCPIGAATEKVIRAVEENGGVVVGFENCTGAKPVDRLIDENAADIYLAMADKYLNIGCSVMSPNPNRYELLGRMIDEYHADGVLDMTLQACLTYSIETRGVRRFVQEEKKKKYLAVETDYSQADVGQLNTRVAAFLEML